VLGFADIGSGIIAVRYTLPGDTDLDGAVALADLGTLATNYGLSGGTVWAQGDFNDNGQVDVGDLGALASNYGSSIGAGGGTAADVASSTAVAAVPEPSCIGLLLACAAGSFRRHRRR
jgi:hypothetical protein